MASNNLKLQKKNLPKIERDVYSKIAVNNLLVFAVHTLQEQGVTASVEEIVSICFRLFPHSFSLKHYTRWPDSALVIRRLNDGREKGNIKGSAAEGFLLKYKGKQLARRIARKLGLAAKTSLVSQQKKPIAMIAKKKLPEKQLSKPVKKIIPKSIAPSKQTIQKKPAKVKSGILPLTKAERKPAKKSVILSLPLKKTPIKKKAQKPRLAKRAQPIPLTLAVPPVHKKKESIKPQRIKAQVVQLKKVIKSVVPKASIQISREEKAKAGKVIQLMERSDAYRLYRKNGDKSKISEFDFRSLLLCTMESSAETLARNVNLFKGYVSVYNRADLTTFLNFCEESFTVLLKPTGKKVVKK